MLGTPTPRVNAGAHRLLGLKRSLAGRFKNDRLKLHFIPMRFHLLLLLTPLFAQAAASTSAAQPHAAMFRQYCFGCHGKSAQMAGLNLEQLSDPKSTPGEQYQKWQKIAAVLDQKRMPPAKMPQPSDSDRTTAAAWIRTSLKDYITRHAGDPGPVTVRRLTSGEYGYTIQDLTGLDLKFDRDFVGDSVGGEGFANFGDVQFMQDASLERYLQTAKQIAAHAVIGAGPIQFYADPGKSGLEMSAIHRIDDIYSAYGFSASSGEGGKPYGIELYGKALYACWQYKHRSSQSKSTLADFAKTEGVTARFAGHLWQVLHQKNATFPTVEVIDQWHKIPALSAAFNKSQGLAANIEVQKHIIDWPRWLLAAGEAAAGGLGDERALVLTEETVQAKRKQHLKFNIINRARQQSKTAQVFLSAVPVNPIATEKAIVYWRNATLRFRGADKAFGPRQPLLALLDPAVQQRLGFGINGIPPADFATLGEVATTIEINMPTGSGIFELDLDLEIADGDAVMRCTLSDKKEALTGRPIYALLANPNTQAYKTWKANVLDFAANLPSISQGEAAPSDKDPIPAPYNNAYNQRERDAFHPKVKYYRSDKFLVDKMLDDPTRLKLNQAWNDLLASFDYHDQFLQFVAEKYKLNLDNKSIAQLDDATIQSLPVEPRKYVAMLRNEFHAVRDVQLSAQPSHVEDSLRFAAKAWRRPLTANEKADLRTFYDKMRKANKLEHAEAIRLLLARILVAPAFLYRLEQTAAVKPDDRALSPSELASRISYFLWSSIPDAELERAAAAGELNDPRHLEKQVQRMLHHPKSRRMSTEFFGQWLGFYRFDQFTGVDTGRFPEFTDDVKTSMYDEAVTFFEHLVRQDRPIREMFSASYTFLNQPLAKHYGITQPVKALRDLERVDQTANRGGVLRLGAVLTATSAPLRTSPVKRGDWVLRRILGTPTPPPPADAGTLPSDDKAFGGISLREKLAAHQRNATCAGCHSRIDPMGFPLERYDSVGRWRQAYPDGKPIEDSSTTSDKHNIAGTDGLIAYLQTQEDQVLKNMSRKMLGYALGRTALASDEPLIDKLAQSGAETSVVKMASEIVMSRQFRYRRPDADTSAVQTAHNNRGSAK